ncbi:MAG: hypothetical protein AAEJ65_06010, partial [Planctomycetota bacterium]
MFRAILNPSVAAKSRPTLDTRSNRAVLPENARPLQQIAPGELVQIIAETVPIAHLPLLEAMGLCNDCELRVCQSRGTCILDVDGSRVGLSDQ